MSIGNSDWLGSVCWRQGCPSDEGKSLFQGRPRDVKRADGEACGIQRTHQCGGSCLSAIDRNLELRRADQNDSHPGLCAKHLLGPFRGALHADRDHVTTYLTLECGRSSLSDDA